MILAIGKYWSLVNGSKTSLRPRSLRLERKSAPSTVHYDKMWRNIFGLCFPNKIRSTDLLYYSSDQWPCALLLFFISLTKIPAISIARRRLKIFEGWEVRYIEGEEDIATDGLKEREELVSADCKIRCWCKLEPPVGARHQYQNQNPSIFVAISMQLSQRK